MQADGFWAPVMEAARARDGSLPSWLMESEMWRAAIRRWAPACAGDRLQRVVRRRLGVCREIAAWETGDGLGMGCREIAARETGDGLGTEGHGDVRNITT